MGGGDRTEDMINQLRRALDELEFGTPERRDQVIQGVRTALGRVRDNLGGARRDRGSKPDLHVVSGDDEPSDPADPQVTIHLIDDDSDEIPAFNDRGRIAVPGGPEEHEDAWQTVFHTTEVGIQPTYRIRCLAGVLDVSADGTPVARLRPGQDCDIEANSIRVRGVGGRAVGRFTRM